MKKILLSLALVSLIIFIALPNQVKAEENPPKINFTLCYSSDNSLFAGFSLFYMPLALYDLGDYYQGYEYLGVYADVNNTIPLNKEKQFLCEVDAGIIYGFDQNFAISLNYRTYRAPFPNHIGITVWYDKSSSQKTNTTFGISIISKKGIGVHFKIKQSLTKTMGLHCFTDFYYTLETKLLMGGIRWGQKISGGLYAVIDGRCFLFEKETKAFVAGGLQYSF